MTLSSSRMSNSLLSLLAGKGFVGSELPKFTEAIATGSINSIIGKSFNTIDTGLVPGIGTGVGTGLIGVSPAVVLSTGLSIGTGLQLLGVNFPDIVDAFATSLISEITQATLTSNHTPVFSGTGIITPGSIPVNKAEWKLNISNLGIGKGFVGISWPDVADALASAGETGLKLASGNVAISGTFTGSSPPGPLPGGGLGSGIIT